jgi:hypothetical protein
MVLAFSFVPYWSNGLILLSCAVVLLFLLKSINIKDKLWLASICGVLTVALISIYQIIAHNNLMEQLREKEAKIAALQTEYDRMIAETEHARTTFEEARGAVKTSRAELDALQKKVNAEFDKTVNEIKRIYANISDEELDRRLNETIRKSRKSLQTNVFK